MSRHKFNEFSTYMRILEFTMWRMNTQGFDYYFPFAIVCRYTMQRKASFVQPYDLFSEMPCGEFFTQSPIHCSNLYDFFSICLNPINFAALSNILHGAFESRDVRKRPRSCGISVDLQKPFLSTESFSLVLLWLAARSVFNTSALAPNEPKCEKAFVLPTTIAPAWLEYAAC